MKKIFFVLLITAAFLFHAFAEKKPDIDLTKLPANMVYSTVFNMMVEPEFFDGKTIKVSGECTAFDDEVYGGKVYCCLVLDAMQCCAQGIEFKTKNSVYPAEGKKIVVTGTFEQYLYNGLTAFRLKDANILQN